VAESTPPGLAGRATLRCSEEVLERDVQEGGSRLREDLVGMAQVAVDVYAAAVPAGDVRGELEIPVDRHGPAIAHEDAGRHGREAVPRREQTACLVERGGDQPAVRDAGPTLMTVVEAEARAIGGAALDGRGWKPDSARVRSATPARGVVVRRDAQRRPPRSWCARKKFSEPDVAMAADAEISSASAAAATICAKR
jgi:hypothetical protein